MSISREQIKHNKDYHIFSITKEKDASRQSTQTSIPKCEEKHVEQNICKYAEDCREVDNIMKFRNIQSKYMNEETSNMLFSRQCSNEKYFYGFDEEENFMKFINEIQYDNELLVDYDATITDDDN